MTALEPRPYAPPEPEMISVPAWRLDELEQVRREMAVLRAQQVATAPGQARRINRVGPWQTERQDAAQPLRTAATEERRRTAADVILGLRTLGGVGLAVIGTAATVVVLAVLYGLFRLALRFVAWAAEGNALAGGLVLVVACVAIVLGGLAVFLRMTDGRRDR